MKYCTGKIVEWLINHDAIESDDKELYEYALYSLWLLVTPLFLAIIVGLCFGRIKEGIVIVIPFMLLRNSAVDIMHSIYGYVLQVPHYC